MTKPPHSVPLSELTDLVGKLRQSAELQEIVRAGGEAPPIGKRAGPAAGTRKTAPPPASPLADQPPHPAGTPPPASRPAPPRRTAPPPAARVTAPPPSTAPPPAARVIMEPAPSVRSAPPPPVYGAIPPAEALELFDSGRDSVAEPTQPWQGNPARCASLGDLQDTYADCHRCPLGGSRTNLVFGNGNPKATVVFVGEAPGREEDLQGEAFVGRAGQLLNKILAAIGWHREEVYIANILKCRPPGNRDPQPEEITACAPILARQIELIDPVILCSLGAYAARVLLGVRHGISRLRGQVHYYRGKVPLVPTFHPAALLRNPHWKKPTWEDVQLLRREHDRLLAERTGQATND